MDEIHGFLTAKFLYENALAYGVDTDLDFIIADDPEYAYKYARYVLKARWELAEKTISKHPKWAYKYAKYVIKGKWKKAEKHIKSNNKVYNQYLKLISKLK